MAVQKSRKTRSKKGMKRSHDRLVSAHLADDTTTGQSHRRHHVAEDGYYRGRQVVAIRPKTTEEDAE